MRRLIGVAVLLVCAGLVHAGTRADLSGDSVIDFQTTMDMPFMAVGNAGNAVDTEIMIDDTTGYGSVGDDYHIGKFEVAAGQYTEFLNAVAATDTYGLYNTSMWSDTYGCKIERSGEPGSYTYSVAVDWADRPVNLVSWGDSARFANWLTNGMPSGSQDLTTTEDGSYYLDGATSDAALQAVTREPDARYVIPSEDEWYKAAYHKNDGVTGNYFDYPTGSDAVPSNDLIDPDPGNNVNYEYDDFTIGSPYWRTEVGEFENSTSPYEIYDMGGNVWEWNEGVIVRGGSHSMAGEDGLQASYRIFHLGPGFEDGLLGFRIAEVPEPATLGMLTLGGLALLRRRKV